MTADLMKLEAENADLKARLAKQSSAGLAWNGHMVHGDKDSIAEVMRLVAISSTGEARVGGREVPGPDDEWCTSCGYAVPDLSLATPAQPKASEGK